MHCQYTPYVIPIVVAAVLSGALTLWGWRRRPAPGALWFTAMMCSACFWASFYVLEMVSVDLPATLLWAKMEYLGGAVVVEWLGLVLAYTGQYKWLTRRNIALLFVIPLITLALAWTNEYHELIWTDVGVTTGVPFNALSFTPGIWYWINAAYAYAIIVLCTILLVITLVRSAPPYRQQIITLLTFALITWLGNMAYIVGLTPWKMDITPTAFALSGLVIAWGLFRYRILDVAPVARGAIIESMRDGVIVLDAQNRVVDLNPAAQALLGHQAPKVVGQPLTQFLTAWPNLTRLCQKARDGLRTEVALNIGDEKRRIFDLSVSPLRGPRGQLHGRLMTLHDVTEQKQIETETRLLLTLTQSVSTASDLGAALHAALRLIVEHTGWIFGEAWLPSADGSVMENGRVSYYRDGDLDALQQFDQISHEFTFVPGAGMPGRVWRSGRPEWQQDISSLSIQVYHRVQHGIEAGLKAALGVPVLAGEQVLAVLAFYMAEPRSKDQHLVSLVTAVAAQLGTVLQNKQAEETMRLQAAALDAAANGIVITDRAGKINWVNAAFTRLTGYTFEEAVAQNPRLLKSDQHELGFFEQLWETILAGKAWHGEMVNRRKDGSTYIEEQTITPVRDKAGEIAHFVAIKQDITARKRAESALRENEARFRSLTQSAHDAIIIADGEGRILLWNGGAQTIFGYREQETPNLSLTLLMPERYRDAHQNGMARLRATGKSHVAGRLIELEGLRRDGREFPLAVSISSWEAGGERFFGAIIRDITERKQAEETLQRYAAELEIQNAELDAFAHTVAHDLKNPLTAIIGYSALLQAKLAELPDDKKQDFVQKIEQSGNKMRNIIDELLLLASVREMEEIDVQPLDMQRIVAEGQKRLEYMLREYQAEIVTPHSWPEALGYGPWVEEVWVNYISNALKYGGQPPRIELGATVEPERVRFWVRDNGAGLTPVEQARLFMPFERLYQVSAQGHGLGLSIVQRIVKRLGGRVGVESTKGQGSTFYFTLPRAHNKTENANTNQTIQRSAK